MSNLKADVGPYAIIPEWVVRAVGGSALRVYWELARMANTEGACWPSVGTIAERAGMNEKTARTAIAELEKAQAVSIESRTREEGGQTSNLYTVNLAPPSQKLGVPPPENGEGGRAENREGRPTENRDPNYSQSNELSKNESLVDLAGKVVDHLNGRTGRKYAKRGAQFEHITARLKDGETPEQLILAVDHACAKWLGDERMEQFIRPQTLFGPENYLGYKAEAEFWDKNGRKPIKKPSATEAARRQEMHERDQNGNAGQNAVQSNMQDILDKLRRDFFLQHGRAMTPEELADARKIARRIEDDGGGDV